MSYIIGLLVGVVIVLCYLLPLERDTYRLRHTARGFGFILAVYMILGFACLVAYLNPNTGGGFELDTRAVQEVSDVE